MDNLIDEEMAVKQTCCNPVTEQTTCIASCCMAWRQVTSIKGFCGLAGDPRINEQLDSIAGFLEEMVNKNSS